MFAALSTVLVIGMIAIALYCYSKRKNNRVTLGIKRKLSVDASGRLSISKDGASPLPFETVNSVEATPALGKQSEMIVYDFSGVGPATALPKKGRSTTLKAIAGE